MRTRTKGLILNEQSVGERDRLITVLTRDRGIVRCFVRGGKSFSNKSFAATHTMCYSKMNIFVGKNSEIVDDAELIRFFSELRQDIEKLALVQYMFEIAICCIPQGLDSEKQLSLILNCMHFLSTGDRSDKFVKTVFEVRLMLSLGFVPDILYCYGCGCYEADVMYFDCQKNSIVCSSCAKEGPNMLKLSRGALTALRYIIVAEPKKIFSFNISQESLDLLSQCSEMYVLSQINKHPGSLDFYKQVCAVT